MWGVGGGRQEELRRNPGGGKGELRSEQLYCVGSRNRILLVVKGGLCPNSNLNSTVHSGSDRRKWPWPPTPAVTIQSKVQCGMFLQLGSWCKCHQVGEPE